MPPKRGVDAADDDGVLTGALHGFTQVSACQRDGVDRLSEGHTARVGQDEDAAMVVLKLVRYGLDRPLREEGDVCDRLRAHGVVVDDDRLLAPLLDGRSNGRRKILRPLRREVGEGLLKGELWQFH